MIVGTFDAILTAATTDLWGESVIASAATQSRGLALSILLVALDCFAALAMTASVVAIGHWFGRLVLYKPAETDGAINFPVSAYLA